MPAPLILSPCDDSIVADYLQALTAVDHRTGRSTVQAARTCQARITRAGGWDRMVVGEQIEAAAKAPAFASWLMATGQVQAPAELLATLTLHLGHAGRLFCPAFYGWFARHAATLDLPAWDLSLQWNTLIKVTATSGVAPEHVDDATFADARAALLSAYRARGRHESGRNLAAVFHRLQLTLFQAGRLSGLRGPRRREPVSVTGWAVVAPRIAAPARRYVEQVSLSLRPATVTHIEHDLRVFGTWLAVSYPDVTSCAELTREHIEGFKTWLGTHPTLATGRPLGRVSVKNALINLHCFFDRISDWGYPDAPVRPLLFIGDLPIVDKPLPRFLDDATAAKLLRTTRADPDPLSRLIVEILARTGIRRGELLALTVDSVVQIGSAFWLRIPIGKLHNDRYVPLHPDLKDLLDEWVTTHRPAGLRSDRLLIDNNRPITNHHVTRALNRLAEGAGIGHVTAHQLRHTLATQAVNRGMSLDAIAALLGHKTLAMTMIYARIADRTVADEYFAVTEKVEALYGQPHQLDAHHEGTEMRHLREEMHYRLLGNGYCARPLQMDCQFETICESCSCFVTTSEFRPTLQQQRDDAEAKHQVGRQRVLQNLLDRLDSRAS